MGFFTDAVALSRFQFALTVIFHFLFVPLSIGLGLFMALSETRYYKTRDSKDKAATKFWAKIFTTTFIIGVASGITMEFSFGTNWANYSRFVGDIFGAPLAAEALLAFFLESIFLGIVLFGRNRVSPKAYLVSCWMTWFGSALSALWILIANSWMQTPAGFELLPDGSKAVITDFWAAALNPSSIARYLHTVDSLLILGAFCVMAVGAWYLKKGRDEHHGVTFMQMGLRVGIITVILMLPLAHMQAKVVAEYQPAKLAAMEGHWEDGPMDLSIIGWVDQTTGKTWSISIPGGASFLGSGNFDTIYPGLDTIEGGLNSFDDYDGVKASSYQGGIPPVNITFQAYHLMICLYGLMIIWLIVASRALFSAKKGKTSTAMLSLMVWGPLIPFLAIQSGWMVAEIGRQPWVVYDLLLTLDAVSPVVSAPEILITISLFIVFYSILLISWLRVVLGTIKTGPVEVDESAGKGTKANKAIGSKTAAQVEGGE
ncbi:MAG: cytochrome ubiquinol oxidase subunit I [Coriobacteriia bacterium]|nr:cytochrome ubiquinol oxidase subunit I [Coriobacteriia bacterium]